MYDRKRPDRGLDNLGPRVEQEIHRQYGRRGRFHSLVIGGLIATFGITLLATNLGWTDLRTARKMFALETKHGVPSACATSSTEVVPRRERRLLHSPRCGPSGRPGVPP